MFHVCRRRWLGSLSCQYQEHTHVRHRLWIGSSSANHTSVVDFLDCFLFFKRHGRKPSGSVAPPRYHLLALGDSVLCHVVSKQPVTPADPLKAVLVQAGPTCRALRNDSISCPSDLLSYSGTAARLWPLLPID